MSYYKYSQLDTRLYLLSCYYLMIKQSVNTYIYMFDLDVFLQLIRIDIGENKRSLEKQNIYILKKKEGRTNECELSLD